MNPRARRHRRRARKLRARLAGCHTYDPAQLEITIAGVSYDSVSRRSYVDHLFAVSYDVVFDLPGGWSEWAAEFLT